MPLNSLSLRLWPGQVISKAIMIINMICYLGSSYIQLTEDVMQITKIQFAYNHCGKAEEKGVSLVDILLHHIIENTFSGREFSNCMSMYNVQYPQIEDIELCKRWIIIIFFRF